MDSLRHSLRLRLAVILVGITAGTILVGTLINNTFLGNYYTLAKQEEMMDMYDTINRTFVYDETNEVVMATTEDIQRLRVKCYNLGIQILIVDTSYEVCFANVPSSDQNDSENLLSRIKEIIIFI